ncbi:MAG: hypothetical protein WB699_19970 [Bacteroidota bacterium]
MKTAGAIILILGLLMTFSTGLTYGTNEKVLTVAELEIPKENQRATNWQLITGIEVMVIGGAFFAVSAGRNSVISRWQSRWEKRT